jgi:hypothetical protein
MRFIHQCSSRQLLTRITHKDAQLIYNRFVRQYCLPSEGAAMPALAQRDDYNQRDRAADHDANHRVRHNKHRTHDDVTTAPNGEIHITAAMIGSAINQGGTCWRCRST